MCLLYLYLATNRHIDQLWNYFNMASDVQNLMEDYPILCRYVYSKLINIAYVPGRNPNVQQYICQCDHVVMIKPWSIAMHHGLVGQRCPQNEHTVSITKTSEIWLDHDQQMRWTTTPITTKISQKHNMTHCGRNSECGYPNTILYNYSAILNLQQIYCFID